MTVLWGIYILVPIPFVGSELLDSTHQLFRCVLTRPVSLLFVE